jgi:hypothetical protein
MQHICIFIIYMQDTMLLHRVDMQNEHQSLHSGNSCPLLYFSWNLSLFITW